VLARRVCGKRTCKDDYAQVQTASSHAAPGAAGVSPPWDRETHSDRRFRNCSADCRPACWRTPLRLRCRVPRGAYAPPLLFARVRPPAELRLFRCTNAHPQERRPGAHRGAGSALAKTIPHTFADDRRAQARSGGCQPAVFVGNARARMTRPGFTQRRRARIRSGGCQPAVCRADALAKALLHLLGRLPTGVLAHSVAVAFP